MRTLIFCLVIFQITSALAQQSDLSWKQTLPNNRTWRCEIQKDKQAGYTPETGVKLLHKENSLTISDFTGGFFKQYSENNTFPVELEFQGNSIIPITVKTSYGPCKISGQWDPQNSKLTINWKIDFNKIDETSILTPLDN